MQRWTPLCILIALFMPVPVGIALLGHASLDVASGKTLSKPPTSAWIDEGVDGGLGIEGITAYVDVPDAPSIETKSELLSLGGQSDGSAPFRRAPGDFYLFDHALNEIELSELPGAPTPESEASTGARQLFVKQGTECLDFYPLCGTEIDPFDDIDLCADELRPGETCWVMNGFYYQGIDYSDNSPYQPARSGTSSQRIAFRAYPGDRPTIASAPGVTWNFGMRTRRHYITYDGFQIQGIMRVHGDSETSRVVGVIVENCDIWDGGGKNDGNWSGIFAEYVEDLTIRNNVIRSIRSPTHGSAKGITIFNGRRVMVENNFIYDNPSEGIFDKEGGEDNVYRRNVFWDNKVGIKVNNQGDSRDVQNERTLIYENVFVCEDEGINEAIRLLHQPTDWVIRNNTGYECKSIVVRSGSGPANGGVVYNNIWWASTAEKTMWESQNGDDREPDYMDYNLYAPNGKYRENRYTDESATHYSLSSWRSTPHPLWYDDNSFEGDPIFVDPENGDFHLAVGSPAIGAGLFGEDLGAYPLGNEVSVGPPPARYDCLPGAVGHCPDAKVPDAENENLACGGSCKSIPSFPIQGVVLGALALALLEITLSEITLLKTQLESRRSLSRRER